MNRKAIQILFLIIMLFSVSVMGDGIIIIHPPHPIPMPRPRPEYQPVRYTPLSVKYHRVNVTIENNVAVTTIDEEFYNPNNAILEGTFIFPLPEMRFCETLQTHDII